MASPAHAATAKSKARSKHRTAAQAAALRRRQALAAKRAAARRRAAAEKARRLAAARKPTTAATTAPRPTASATATVGGALPAPASPAPAAAVAPAPAPGPVDSAGRFSAADAERLLWRAGFGPRPGDVERFVAQGLEASVRELVHPQGDAQLTGPAPTDDSGAALSPNDIWGHAHCWWLDRMVRSDQPLVERMTLVWHDWFACSNDKVNHYGRMIAQNALFRRHALGSFGQLLADVTVDPAMLDFLDGLQNRRGSLNENYAREVMELFALGAGRGAYTETDIRELAKALTGWRADWVNGPGLVNFRFDPALHDASVKTVFGQTGAFTVEDAVRLVLEHPMHPSFLVTKLWGSFIPTPPDAATQARLQDLYVSSGRQVAPLLEVILSHPDLYAGPAMVKPPVVFTAGLLRATGQAIRTDAWGWLDSQCGQMLFYPPNVAGWDDSRWLDSSTWNARWYVAVYALKSKQITPWPAAGQPATYSATEDAPTAVAAALASIGSPHLGDAMRQALVTAAGSMLPATMASWEKAPYRAMRFNGLRLLAATCSDAQAS